MAHRADDIRQDIADAQQDIDNTRAAMTEKLEMLEERVWETVEDAQSSVEDMVGNVKEMVDTTVAAVRQSVEGAQSTVEEIVENVKDTVDTTVATVKRTFDLYHQVDQHPWLMFGGSLLVGYMVGNWGSGRRSSAVSTNDPRRSPTTTTVDISTSPSRPGSLTSYSEGSSGPPLQQGMVSSVLDQFKDEITLIKGAAVGAVMSTLYEMLKQALLPPPAPHSPSARTQVGGQPSDRPAQSPASPSKATADEAPFADHL